MDQRRMLLEILGTLKHSNLNFFNGNAREGGVISNMTEWIERDTLSRVIQVHEEEKETEG